MSVASSERRPRTSAFGAAPRCSGASISCRFDASTLTSTPFSGIVSPGLTTISFAPAAAMRGAKRRHHGVGALAGLGRRSVSNHVAELHSRRQLLHAADVIGVVVRDDEIVDRADAGFLDGGGNTLGVAQVVCRPAGVDQQRLPRRRDDERRLSAFDVDEIQPQCLRGADGRRQRQHTHASSRSPGSDQFPRPPRAGGCTTSNLRSASRDDAHDQQLERRRAGVLERLRLVQLNRHGVARSNRQRFRSRP